MMEGPEPAGGGGENVGLLVLEPKSLRPFKTKDEYLYAMKEDLAEWFTCLYKAIEIDADNFLEVLETGVLLCRHANEVRKFTDEQKVNGVLQLKSNFGLDIQIPQYDVQFRADVKPGTFLARDNISNFITWTSKMGIPEVLRFETDDLVMRKNERSVVLCLLEVARVGAKFGMLAPTIVQMEEEIDNEIETGEPPPQIITCDVKSLDEMVRELVGRCTCPVQFPIIKVGEGKYKIGDNQTLVFVRILRKHVMIRVGGGWDTLENYLDRHDPCRCGFKGHGRGGGRLQTTPRRTSTVSQSLPNTPKSARKLSLTAPINGTVTGNTPRPASPGMRSASPGPNARKLSLAVKNNSRSQPGSAVPSPAISDKQPSFSTSGLNSSAKSVNVSQNGVSSSGSFVKQAQSKISRQHSSSSSGITPRRSVSPAPRPQSPASRRSESPVPTQSHHRLRSPSPAVTSHGSVKGGRTQSVPASPTGRCSSPMKQITLSELRSSREGNPLQHQTLKSQQQQQPSKQSQLKETLKRQRSNSSSISEEMMEEASKSGLSIEQISTMSLAEFKNILNNSLSVPNGHAGSQGSSDSPRSQSSVESPRQKKSTDKYAHVKSSYSYRNTNSSANKAASSKPVSASTKPASARRSSLEASTSSGYSSSSVGSDRTVTPSYGGSHRPKTPTSSYSVSRSGTGSRQSSVKGHSSGSHAITEYSATTANSIPKSYSNVSSISESYGVNQYQGSRSSSHSSLRSIESSDSYLGHQGQESTEQMNRIPLTPSSVDSDYSLRSSKSCPTGVPSNYSQSASYTPCGAVEDKPKMDRLKPNTRASSEPKGTTNANVTENGDSMEISVPKNVGYFTVLRLNNAENEVNGHDDDDDDIEQELASMKSPIKEHSPVGKREPSIEKQSVARPVTPSGRKTPSMIPRPMTPKISKQFSVPQHSEPEQAVRHTETRSTGRPPTPKKSTIIARAPVARSADSSKERTYQEIFRNRSSTPGPGNKSTSASNLDVRRSMTPGPYLNKTTTLSSTSATVSRARLNEGLQQAKADMPLSLFSGESGTPTRSRDSTKSGSRARSQSVDRKKFLGQKSVDQPETVIQVSVNRDSGHHVLTVEGESGSRKQTQSAQKSKVLARARTDDNRARAQTRTTPLGIKQRPQSVEPRQLMPRKNSGQEVLTVRRGEQGEHKVYDRTQEWVQTAVEQTTKVQKTSTARNNASPHVRRAMTPNSFNLRIGMDNEEPKSLAEIKAELTLPINGINLNSIDLDKVDAPPEDPELYATMEKMFHELRQQELKKSVNETPGSSGNTGVKSSKTKSTSSNNDEEMSLDSNKNVKKKTLSVSTKSSSNVTSPALSRANKGSSGSINLSKTLPARPQSASRTSSTSSTNTSTSRQTPSKPSTPSYRPQSPSPKPSLPAKPKTFSTKSSVPSTPVASTPVARPASPRTTVTSQRPPSPRTTVSSQRPPSPRTAAQPPRPQSPSQRPPSPRTAAQPPRPQSPSQRPASPRVSTNLKRVSSTSNVNAQPTRPASTPPRATTPVARQASKSSDDSDDVFEREKKNVAGTLFSKLKDMIKVKPRKDKAEGIKNRTRIPAPKSLASTGKSKSFTNLSSLSNTMSLVHTDSQNYCLDDTEMSNGFDYEHTNGGLNATLPARSETPAPRLITPLKTGRSTLIRKESMDKNKTVNKFVKAVSVDRDLSEYQQRSYDLYEEGEYV